MELLKKIEDLVAPLVGLTTSSADEQGKEKVLPEVTDPEGIVEDEYCMDGRKDVGSPVEIAKERAALDLSKCAGYKLSHVQDTASGLQATLTLDGAAADLYGKDIKDLTIEVEYETSTRLRVHIYDTARQQFQIPESTLFRCASEASPASASELEFHHSESPFAFWVSRRSTGDVIFDTRSLPLVVSDQFLHIATKLPGDANVYGPSEIISESGFRRDPAGTHSTLWTRDAGTPINENIYGAHPFYMETRYPSASTTGASASRSHGVFLRNSHGMDISQTPSAMTYNIIGGTLDFYFIAGPSQQDVVRQYAQIVGLPARQPFWAFGLHMCRWNRDDTKGEWGTPEGVWEIVTKMKEAGVPLETVWSDLDYMDKVRNWDSNERWSHDKYKALIDKLHAHGQHYVPIIDAAIGITDPKDKDDKYFAYEKGTELDVWIKDKDGETYIGEVWPGKTVFPDWTHPKTDEWWQACFDKYRTYAPYDGIWLDMNEPASFQTERPIPKGELDSYDFPKYKIDNAYGELWEKTVSPSAKLADGSRHYHQHNLFGHCENISTRKLLLKQEPEKRPFIISRSTFAGTGQLSGHWLGDNYSTWTSMRNSIQGILQFQMFQVPMVGPDACGFTGDCTEELANRWMQLGAFYPFFRNHNVEQAKPQEPFRWPAVAAASRKALDVRYRLLPYWETLFAQASKTGTPPVRPLAWEFDEPKYAAVHEQFLLGSAILVTPVLKRGGVQVTGYLPKAKGPWRDWWTHKPVETDANDKATLPTPLGSINVHIRAGSVLLVHNKSAYTLTETKAGSYGLIVSLDDEGNAEGEAVIDDGLTNDSKSTEVSFSASSSSIKISGSGSYAAPKLTSITVLGSKAAPATVTVAGQEVQVQTGEYSYSFEVSVDLREGTEIKF